MKKSLLFPLILLFLSGCFSDDFEEYDDTQDLAYLEEYRLQEGVLETNSGILYKVIEEGEGSKPGTNDIAVLDLLVKHVVTGDVIIDSYDYGYSEVVPLQLLTPNLTGLQEAVQLMNIGSSYELVLPAQLAWRDGKVFIFEVVLHNTQDLFVSEYASQDDVHVTDSGLYYRIIEEGDGEVPGSGSFVNVNYTGSLISGAKFDEGEDAGFNLAGVIDGFSEGIQLMKTGSKYEFLIPANLAYGDDSPGGIIYPGAALKFEVELLSFQN